MSAPALAPPARAGQSNLAFALRCLPRERREPALVFYRFCRAVDDVADDPALPVAAKRAALDAWREAVSGGEGLPGELAAVVRAFDLDRAHLAAIVEGCAMDIGPQRFAGMDELRVYCWKVACAVGLCSARLFGCRDPATPFYAEHLGYALQFTNILRDVGEDAGMGRVYLPEDLLVRHGVAPADLLAGKPPASFRAAAAAFASEARAEFAAAVAPAADRIPLRPAETMAAIYRTLLGRIERDGYRVFDRRYRLSRPEKLMLLARVWLGWQGAG